MFISNYHIRKQKRVEHYFRYIYKNKLVKCMSCNGSGYYDHFIGGRTPKCDSCNGLGKVRERYIYSISLMQYDTKFKI